MGASETSSDSSATCDLSRVYTAHWFRHRGGYRRAYRAFARAIETLWRPRSLLDLGCGAGYVVEYFAGKIPTAGVDGSEAVLKVQSEAARRCTSILDLTGEPAPFVPHYEFVVSVEVAEHIPRGQADRFMAWFRWADRVFFTAAPPGQGGLEHLNEQPPDYWISRFARMGFRGEPQEADRWRAHVLEALGEGGCPWVRRNAMFFTREGDR